MLALPQKHKHVFADRNKQQVKYLITIDESENKNNSNSKKSN